MLHAKYQIKAQGLIVSEKNFFNDFPAKNFKPMGWGQFVPGGHNLKEFERGPPKEQIGTVVSEKKNFKDFLMKN